MQDDILNTLHSLRSIKPDADYAKHSRMLVLSSPQELRSPEQTPPARTMFQLARLSAVLGAGVIALVSILGSVFYINDTYSPLALEGLNRSSLSAEAKQINDSIEITLNTIDLVDESNQTALRKIDSITATGRSATAVHSVAPAATSTPVDAFLINESSATSSDRAISNTLDSLSR